MLSLNATQMPIIVSDKRELRRCTMHLWPNFNGLGLILKYSLNENSRSPHIIKQVEVDSPAYYSGVLNNDLILKVGNRLVETEKFDLVLKLIKEQLKKEKKCDLLLINSEYYQEFRQKYELNGRVDYNSASVTSQIKYYQSPLFNPNRSSVATLKTNADSSPALYDTGAPEPRLCHLLTWSNYDGYGFYTAFNNDGCFIRNVELNSPAQLGGLRDYDRILEINGKQVSSKDREFIMKQINKHKLGAKNALASNTLKSQSAYSIGTNKSSKSSASNNFSNNTFLTLLVADPNTYKWLTDRRIPISTRNKNLKIQQCYTPPENSILQLMNQQQQQQPPSDTVRSNRSNNNTILRSSDIPRDVFMKRCTIRRLRGQEKEPLGLEMTKYGNSPNFINNVIPASAAALSGLCKDDYLIELNDRNIEDLDNSALRERIFQLLENGGEFSLTTINKVGYEYCLENGIKPGNFVQINRHNVKEFETPRDKSSFPSDGKQNDQRPIPNLIGVSKENKSTSTGDSPVRPTFNMDHMPRICVLHKTNENDELGFSIARMKNFNEHIINEVVPGSLADLSGLKPNDCLLEVNGENVENKSHADTVKKISELKRLKNVDINLLVVQKEHLNIQSSLQNANNLNKVSSVSTPDLLNIDNGTNKNIVSIVNNNYNNNNNRLPKSTSTKRVDSAGTLPVSASKNKNNYPEIKVCEFIGYPKGTQLGLVVTSDECSHDIVKVADNSPAAKCGIVKDDVIIAVNDVNVEGNPSSIELLNDFGEHKPLKILVASKFAYEWSKLLQIKIAEKDWPNIKKTTNRYIGLSNAPKDHHHIITDHYNANPDRYRTVTNYESSFYETNRNYLAKSAITTTNFNDHLPNNAYNTYDPRCNSLRNNIYHRSSSANDNYNDIIMNNAGTSSGGGTCYTPNMSRNINYKRPVTSASTARSSVDPCSNSSNQLNYASTLGRSAVDITADGRVLRLCTLILDPHSPIPTDSEFGFDLVTKIGANQRISDYHIDTIDENSPASRSGLRAGDRLVEVDGIDVTNKTFEQVVQLINEAKLRSKLKLLVYPSAILNYGNPNISSQANLNLNSSCVDSRSLPDLTIQPNYTNTYTNYNEFSKSMYKKKQANLNKYPLQQQPQQQQLQNDYDSIYLKRNGAVTSTNLSKSSSNLYTTDGNMIGGGVYQTESGILRPVPRLCTIFKHDAFNQQYVSSSSSSNIGFGVNAKPTSSSPIYSNYMRVSLVNYKSPAYFSGLETGDLIFEINGRNSLTMSQDEALHFIKSSYEVNGYVKLLVVSEFAFNWLRENDLLSTINSDDRNVFSYGDYLKHNHRFVPRLCKIKLFPFSKSFGFNVETILIRANNSKLNNKSYQSYAHVVMKVDRDSPASSSSLQKADRIIEIDGVNVEGESEQQITERIYQAFVSVKQITLFVVDPDTDNFFKSKCIKLHSMLPIVQHITNSTDI